MLHNPESTPLPSDPSAAQERGDPLKSVLQALKEGRVAEACAAFAAEPSRESLLGDTSLRVTAYDRYLECLRTGDAPNAAALASHFLAGQKPLLRSPEAGRRALVGISLCETRGEPGYAESLRILVGKQLNKARSEERQADADAPVEEEPHHVPTAPRVPLRLIRSDQKPALHSDLAEGEQRGRNAAAQNSASGAILKSSGIATCEDIKKFLQRGQLEAAIEAMQHRPDADDLRSLRVFSAPGEHAYFRARRKGLVELAEKLIPAFGLSPNLKELDPPPETKSNLGQSPASAAATDKRPRPRKKVQRPENASTTIRRVAACVERVEAEADQNSVSKLLAAASSEKKRAACCADVETLSALVITVLKLQIAEKPRLAARIERHFGFDAEDYLPKNLAAFVAREVKRALR